MFMGWILRKGSLVVPLGWGPGKESGSPGIDCIFSLTRAASFWDPCFCSPERPECRLCDCYSYVSLDTPWLSSRHASSLTTRSKWAYSLSRLSSLPPLPRPGPPEFVRRTSSMWPCASLVVFAVNLPVPFWLDSSLQRVFCGTSEDFSRITHRSCLASQAVHNLNCKGRETWGFQVCFLI